MNNSDSRSELRTLTDPEIRTEAVIAGLRHVRQFGGTMARNADGTPSANAHVVGYALLRGAEAVQAEYDRYAAELDRETKPRRMPAAVMTDADARRVVGEITRGGAMGFYSANELRAARLYTGGAPEAKRRIDRELDRRQRADDDERAREEGDEHRDYAEERYNAATMREG